jgi:hypothetical protein
MKANSVSYTNKVAPSSNIAGLQADKDRAMSAYNSTIKPLSNSYEKNQAVALEQADKIATLGAKYDSAIADKK